MKLLLDTNVVLWCKGDIGELSADIRAIIRAANNVYVSAASAWEAEIKRAKGKLMFPFSFTDLLEPNGFRELPVTMRYVAATSALPFHHSDPFDRMLVRASPCRGLHACHL